MKSLLERIDDRLAMTSDVNMRAEYLAERACYMARIGDAAGSSSLVKNLRQDYGDGRSARVSIRLMLAEGVAAYYGGLGDDADNRILRAVELSRALRIVDLGALCAAWLAHMQFFRSNYAKSLQLVDEALMVGKLDDGDLQSRIGLVVAHSLMYAGRRDHAQLWYQYAHGHALAIGDRAAVGALMHNRSVLALAWYRAQQFIDPARPTADAMSFLQLETESSEIYSRAAGVKSIMHTSQLAIAWSRMLLGDYATALELLEQVEPSIQEKETRRNKTSVDADVALCAASLGQFNRARQLIDAVDVASIESLDAGDRVIYVGSCLEVSKILKDSELLDGYTGLFEQAKAAYIGEQLALTQAISTSKACASGPPRFHSDGNSKL